MKKDKKQESQTKARPVLEIAIAEDGLEINTLVEAFSPTAWGHALACSALQLAEGAYEAEIQVVDDGASTPRRAERNEILTSIIKALAASLSDPNNTGSYTAHRRGTETAVDPGIFDVGQRISELDDAMVKMKIQQTASAISEQVKKLELGCLIVVIFDEKKPGVVAYETMADHDDTIVALAAVQDEMITQRRQESGDA